MAACCTRVKETLSKMGIDASKLDNLGFGKYSYVDALILQQKAVGQQHLFNGFKNLSQEKKIALKDDIENLLSQIDSTDFDQVSELYETLFKNPAPVQKLDNLDRVNTFLPLMDKTKDMDEQIEEQHELFRNGILAIAKGKVAVVIQAGGQASRLGSDCPKGAYALDIEGYQEASLFHIFCNKIEALERFARKSLPDNVLDSKDLIQLYIMTSSSTDQDTKDYFAENGNFGLSSGQIKFFQQGEMPTIDNDGKIILEKEFGMFMAPNGNGGLYDGLESQLEDMEKEGIEYIHVLNVDNILNKVADPVMLGQLIANEDKGYEMVSKFVKKTEPNEKVGVHVQIDNKMTIIEYSELSEEQRNAKEGNELKFNQAFIGQFVMTKSLLEQLIKTKNPKKRLEKLRKQRALEIDSGFVTDKIFEAVESIEKKAGVEKEGKKIGFLAKKKIDDELGVSDKQAQFEKEEQELLKAKGWEKWHLAKKNIQPYYDQKEGEIVAVNPEKQTNGMKFEQFNFDCFTEIKGYCLQEIQRKDEFAPIKNREEDPTDNRRTAKELQSKLHMRWLKLAGYKFAKGLKADGEKNTVFVDPRLSYFGEGIPDGSGHEEIESLPFTLSCQLPPKKTSDSVFMQLLTKANQK